MRPPLSQVVVLVSHLQRPRQRSRLASLVAGLAAGYPDVHIEVLDTSVSEALQTARDLEQRGKADVFVCAGATAAYLRRGHAEIRGKFTHFPSIHMINITILKNHMGIAMRRF